MSFKQYIKNDADYKFIKIDSENGELVNIFSVTADSIKNAIYVYLFQELQRLNPTDDQDNIAFDARSMASYSTYNSVLNISMLDHFDPEHIIFVISSKNPQYISIEELIKTKLFKSEIGYCFDGKTVSNLIDRCAQVYDLIKKTSTNDLFDNGFMNELT